MKRATNRMVRPGARGRVKRHQRSIDGVTFVEEGYQAVVLDRVTNTRRRGDWWRVREEKTLAVRTALSGWCRVKRRKIG